MKCNDCFFCKKLRSYPNQGYCQAPSGRYHRNNNMKVDPNIERNCTLFKMKTEFDRTIEKLNYSIRKDVLKW